MKQLLMYEEGERKRDPLIRWLIIAIAVIFIVWAFIFLPILFIGSSNLNGSARTLSERDLTVLQQQVESGKADTYTWAKYIDSLTISKEYDKAEEAANTALSNAKENRSFILASQANLQLAEHNYAQASVTASLAMDAAEKELKAAIDSNVKRGIKIGATLPDSWNTAAFTRATALGRAGDTKAAITAFGIYLQKNPTDADVLTARGNLKADSGDTKGALLDYKTALKYVPNYKPALDAITKIGVDSK